ncbi:hypothetical protein ACET3Z_003885 [Daucus carota]
MGCFVSKHRSNVPSNQAPLPRSPPPHLLEESVKEVLSETPKLRPSTPRILKPPKKTQSLHQNDQDFEGINETHFKKIHKLENPEEVSEISEIYSSMSESFSRENEEIGEIRRKVESPEKFKRRSYSGELHGRRERGVAKSPARRPEQPSPNRVRIVPGRDKRVEQSHVKEMRPVRDAGESSRRRSRSPVIRNDNAGSKQNLGRSPSVRRTGKSPGRVRSDLSENSRKREGSNKEGKWPPTSNELIENPLVSLECFIFL